MTEIFEERKNQKAQENFIIFLFFNRLQNKFHFMGNSIKYSKDELGYESYLFGGGEYYTGSDLWLLAFYYLNARNNVI